MTEGALDPKKVEQIGDRAITYLSGAAISAMVYLGDQLGLYRVLREAGAVTSAELAARSGLHERWVREWLHGQASAGLVRYVSDGLFEFTEEQAAVLADLRESSLRCWRLRLALPSPSSVGKGLHIVPKRPWGAL